MFSRINLVLVKKTEHWIILYLIFTWNIFIFEQEFDLLVKDFPSLKRQWELSQTEMQYALYIL